MVTAGPYPSIRKYRHLWFNNSGDLPACIISVHSGEQGTMSFWHQRRGPLPHFLLSTVFLANPCREPSLEPIFPLGAFLQKDRALATYPHPEQGP